MNIFNKFSFKVYVYNGYMWSVDMTTKFLYIIIFLYIIVKSETKLKLIVEYCKKKEEDVTTILDIYKGQEITLNNFL